MYTSPTQRKSAQARRVIRDAVADAATIATATGVLRLDVLALELEDVPTIGWVSFAEDGMSEDTIDKSLRRKKQLFSANLRRICFLFLVCGQVDE